MAWTQLANFPQFPPGCACCSAPTDGTIQVYSPIRIESMMRDLDRPWEVPYCESCQAHVNATWKASGSLYRRFGVVAFICVLPLTLFHILLISSLPFFLLATGIVALIARIRMRAVRVGPSCASPTMAVLRRGPKGDAYSIRIGNPKYEREFMAYQAASKPQPAIAD